MTTTQDTSDGTKGRRTIRANGEGGGSLRPNGTWQWRVSLDDSRRLCGDGKSQPVATHACLAKVALAEQGVDSKAARQTLRAFRGWWVEDVVRPKAAPKTHRTYADLIRLHVLPTIGAVDLQKLTPQHVTTLTRGLDSLPAPWPTSGPPCRPPATTPPALARSLATSGC